jgi:iron(III) transport system permease protein
MGLMTAKAFTVDDAFSWANFTALLSDPRQAALFGRSFILAVGATVAALALGIPMAIFIHRARTAGHRILSYLYLLPLTIPPQVFVSTWLALVGMLGFTIRSQTASPFAEAVSGIPAAIALLTLAYYPLVVLTTLAGLGALDRRLEEAAALIQGSIAVWRHITLPLLSPYIGTGAVFVFLFALFDYGVPALLGIQTYPVEIFAQFSAFYNEGRAAALSCPLLLIAIALLGLAQKMLGPRVFFTISGGSVDASSALSTLTGTLLAIWSWTIILLSVFVPIGVLLVQAASPQVLLTVLRTSSREMAGTLLLSATASTLVVLIAYPLAERISKSRTIFSKILDFLSLLPFAVPATVLGIGMIYVWNRPIVDKIYGSAAILIIAFTARFVPFAVRAIAAGFGQVAPSLWEAAMLCTKSGYGRWRSIEWPLLKRSVAVGWLIGFILCNNELAATLLVIPPGHGTLSLKIYNLMHYGANQMVAGMALLLVGINLLAAGIVAKQFITRKAYVK